MLQIKLHCKKDKINVDEREREIVKERNRECEKGIVVSVCVR